MVTRRVAETLEVASVCFSRWGRIRQRSAFLFQLSDCKQVSSLFGAMFCYCYWWMCYLKRPPVQPWSTAWFPKYKKPVMCPMKTMHLSEEFVWAWVTVVSVTSTRMNQQYVLNKVSLNRHTHKSRLYIDLLIKILWSEALRNLILYFP